MGTSTVFKMLSLTTTIVGVMLTTLGSGRAALAGLNLVSTTSGQVGSINLSNGVMTELAKGVPLYDIALSSNNQLLGTDSKQLINIDLNKGTFSAIGNLGAFINGLGFTSNDTLYGTGNSGFYQIDTQKGTSTLVAEILGFNSSGDLVYDPANKRFLATSLGTQSDSLWAIALNGVASKIGDIGFKEVYGLLFDQEKLYGYANGYQLAIDPTTGAGSVSQTIQGVKDGGAILGAASAPEPEAEEGTPVPEPATVCGSILAAGVVGVVRSRLQRKQPPTQ